MKVSAENVPRVVALYKTSVAPVLQVCCCGACLSVRIADRVPIVRMIRGTRNTLVLPSEPPAQQSLLLAAFTLY